MLFSKLLLNEKKIWLIISFSLVFSIAIAFVYDYIKKMYRPSSYLYWNYNKW